MNNEISEKRKVAPATFLLFLPPPPKALNPKPTLCHPRATNFICHSRLDRESRSNQLSPYFPSLKTQIPLYLPP